MRRLRTIVLLAILVFVGVLGWQAGSDEIANMEFQGDLHDLAALPTSNWGYKTLTTDDDFRKAVIRKAQDYNIQLGEDDVTVEHPGTDPNAPLYLAAHYTEQVKVATFTMTLHFDPSSTKKFF